MKDYVSERRLVSASLGDEAEPPALPPLSLSPSGERRRLGRVRARRSSSSSGRRTARARAPSTRAGRGARARAGRARAGGSAGAARARAGAGAPADRPAGAPVDAACDVGIVRLRERLLTK